VLLAIALLVVLVLIVPAGRGDRRRQVASVDQPDVGVAA
jgi:hypothetical protein